MVALGFAMVASLFDNLIEAVKYRRIGVLRNYFRDIFSGVLFTTPQQQIPASLACSQDQSLVQLSFR